MPPTPIAVSHVFFDVDGTLVDLVGAMRAAASAAADEIGARGGSGVTPRHLWEKRGTVAADSPDLQFDAVWRESFRRLLGTSAPAEAVDAVFAVYRTEFRERLRPYADVAPALATLHGDGFRLIAASNGAVDLADLGTDRLDRYFSMLHYASEVGVAKPDQRFYLAALDRVGVPAEQALMVGDRVDNDYAPARAVGMQALHLARDEAAEPAPPGVQTIRSLAELPELLTRV